MGRGLAGLRLVRGLGLALLFSACGALPGAAPAGVAPPPPSTAAAIVPAASVSVVASDRAADRPATASRLETRSFVSASLGRALPYVVYLPPGYDGDPARAYPVLYLLHGLGGSARQWIDVGIAKVADRLVASGEIAPFIIAMPEGEGEYWVDHANGGPKWGAYVATDLVREIEGSFRVQADRPHRAIGGLSMGAHGALQLALNYPDEFGTVGAHSLVLRRFGSAPAYFGDRASFAKRDPMQLVTSSCPAHALKLWIDIGDKDPWEPLARQFDRELVQLGIPHQWHVWPGDHSGTYWSLHAADYLRFYGEALSGSFAG